MFHDENIQHQLSVIKDKARKAETPLEQDITFYTGYIIGMLCLKLFKKIELVVNLTNKDYLHVYHEPTKNLYLMHNDILGCVVLNENEFSHFKLYYDYIRPVCAGTSEARNELCDPFLLNANGTPVRKPDQLLRRIQVKYNIGRCTSLEARKAFIQISHFNEQEGIIFDNCSMSPNTESLLKHQARSIDFKERISAVFDYIDKMDNNLLTFKSSKSINQDPEINNDHLGNTHLKCTKNNFEMLLTVYPANVESPTPTVSYVKFLLDSQVSLFECRRLITRWRYRQTISRLDSLPNLFRVVPTKKMIDDELRKLGWAIKLKRTNYEKIQAACVIKRRSCDQLKFLTLSDSNCIRKHISSQTWPCLFVKSNLPVRGRGVFTHTNISKNQVVCNYEGKYLTKSVGEQSYLTQGGCYFFKFCFDSKYHYIDSSEENNTFGRLINHSSIHPNVRPVPKDIFDNQKPEILFTAIRDITAGEELFWNYGEKANIDFYKDCFCELCEGGKAGYSVVSADNSM